MNSTFHLGRIAGIPIGISWTWLPIVALFVWSLSSSVFPTSNPGLSNGADLTMAVIAAMVFFASLVLHELGHAVQARRDGVQIDAITLWLLGGVARFRSGIPTAGAEFRIAVAGPAVTAALAALFLGAAALTRFGAAVDGLLTWLGAINVIVLVFNLIPAFPLDGGRILRAILWRATGERFAATRAAGAVGVAIAAVMIALGIVVAVMGGGGVSGVWLVVVGLFIMSAARSEIDVAAMQSVLEGLVVADVMSRHPTVSQADQTIGEFMAGVSADDHAVAYPVLDGLRPVGILPSPRDATRRAGADESTRVGDRMVAVAHTPILTPDEPASQALMAMMEADTSSALVLDHGHLAGIVSSRDIVEAIHMGDSTPTTDHGCGSGFGG